jgi:hypothetical protein
MQLPPESTNEPEWLQVQRSNKAAERQFALAFGPAQAALGATLLPFLLVDPTAIPITVLLAGIAAYGVIIVALYAKVLRPRTKPRTAGRYVLNYVSIAWAVLGAVALFGMALSLLV